jgi:hypothetical protein
MDFSIGATYKSPRLGRNIKLVSLNGTVNDDYMFSILYIDRDSGEEESSYLTISPSEFKDWTKVN